MLEIPESKKIHFFRRRFFEFFFKTETREIVASLDKRN